MADHHQVLWLQSPAVWLLRTAISSGTLRLFRLWDYLLIYLVSQRRHLGTMVYRGIFSQYILWCKIFGIAEECTRVICTSCETQHWAVFSSYQKLLCQVSLRLLNWTEWCSFVHQLLSAHCLAHHNFDLSDISVTRYDGVILEITCSVSIVA